MVELTGLPHDKDGDKHLPHGAKILAGDIHFPEWHIESENQLYNLQ